MNSKALDSTMKSVIEEVRADRCRVPIQFQANQNVLAVIDDYADAHHLSRAAATRELVMLGGRVIAVFGDVPEEDIK